MTVKSLLLLILGGVFANNYALEQFMGVTPFLGFSGKNRKALCMGLAVTAVMLLTAVVAWPINAFLLEKFSLGYLETPVFAAVVLIAAYLLGFIAKKAGLGSLGAYFPFVALNSAVLGLAVNSAAAGSTFLEALLSALGVGLGFALMMPVMQGVMTRIDQKHVPKAFRGLPISLLAASIISMVLVAFK